MVVLDQALLQYLDQLVDQLASAGAHAAANPEALRELVELSGGADFTPGVAVHLLVTRNLLFVPTLCSEMKRSASEAQRRREGSRKLLAGGVELVWSVCLLKRLVERLVDKERELYKVGRCAAEACSSVVHPCLNPRCIPGATTSPLRQLVAGEGTAWTAGTEAAIAAATLCV